MQVGLPEVTDEAPLAFTATDDGTYRYRLFDWSVVLVDKRTPEGGWENAYRYELGACSCPGWEFRNDCKHSDVARGLIQWWAEHFALAG